MILGVSNIKNTFLCIISKSLRTIECSIFKGTITETFFSATTDLDDEISVKISYDLKNDQRVLILDKPDDIYIYNKGLE